MTRDDVVALQRRRVGSVKILFPFISGTDWRVLGLATVTIVDMGGEIIRVYVKNNFLHNIIARYNYLLGGERRRAIQVVDAGILAYLQLHVPPGVDPSLEVQVDDTL
jgi:hypothetical protein